MTDHPYYVTAYDFARSQPLKRTLVNLSSPTPCALPFPRRSAPSLDEILSSLQGLSSHPGDTVSEDKTIAELGSWLGCIEILPNGNLVEHTDRAASRGSSTPGTSNESTTERSDTTDSSKIGTPLERADVLLLEKLNQSPSSFKKRLGQARFIVPSQSFSHTVITQSQDFSLSISLIHFAAISNRPQLVQFLLSDCECPLESLATVLICSGNQPTHNSSSSFGALTPLTFAVFHDHIAVVSLLVSHGANCNARDSSGESLILF